MVLMATGTSAKAGDSVEFSHSSLAVVTAKGRFVFDVEVADTPAARFLGLQGRRGLASSAGMIFDFGATRPVFMWMKNTPTSLDMVFITNDGFIANIVGNTTPLSLATIGSNGPVRFVLEVSAGTAARLGLRPGDLVIYPLKKDPS